MWEDAAEVRLSVYQTWHITGEYRSASLHYFVLNDDFSASLFIDESGC